MMFLLMVAVSRYSHARLFTSLNQRRPSLYRHFLSINRKLDFCRPPRRRSEGSVTAGGGDAGGRRLRARGGAKKLRPHLDGHTGLSYRVVKRGEECSMSWELLPSCTAQFEV